jgi:O-antigen/teichoic acid export membrane protein
MRTWLRRHAPSGPAVWLVVGRSLGFAATFIVPLVLVRQFDQTTFGTYKQLFLVYTTLFGLAQLGAAESLYYFVPRRPLDAGPHIANAVVTLTLAGGLCAGALTFAAPAIARWLTNTALASEMPLLGAFLGLMLMSALFEIVLVARGRYRAAAWTYGVSDVTRAAFLLVPARLFGGLRGLMLGAVLFAALRLVVMLWSFGRDLGATLRPQLSLWRDQWMYTLPFALAVGIEALQANLHNYVVAARFDPAVFAVYAVGCLQIPLVDVLTTSSANVMMVAMAAGADQRRAGDALALWHDTTRRLALVIAPLVVFLVAMAPQVIELLFTQRYLGSVPVFQLWTCTLLLAVPCVDAVLRARAQTRVLLGLNILRLVIVVSLIGWCLDTFGLSGAALVMLIATAATRAVALVRIARLLETPVRAVMPWRSLAATAGAALVAAVPAVWIARSMPAPPVVVLGAAGVLYLLVYLVLCARVLAHATHAPAVPDRRGRLQAAQP